MKRKYIRPVSRIFAVSIKEILAGSAPTIYDDDENTPDEGLARGGFFDDGMDLEEDCNW